MTTLRIDIETYSSADLKKVGVHRYVEAEDFEITLFGYAYGDASVNVIDLAQGQQLPQHVLVDLTNPEVTKTAFNAAFEMACIARHFDLGIDPAQWQCTSVHALYLGLPGNLGEVGKVLGLSEDQQKLTSGWSLIRYFCMPCKPTKINHGRTRNLPQHDPAKWQLFKDYCKRDVETEREVARKLAKFPVPQSEWDLWHLDQQMMNHGVLVNRQLVNRAIQCDELHKARLMAEAVQLTGLDNPNSRDQLIEWLEQATGEEVEDLTKKSVPKLLSATDDETVQRVLRLRQELAKTSVTKYQAMARAVCDDDRIRGLTQFYGANRTGRWAGRLVQVQNLPQNKLKDLDAARELVLDGEFEQLEMLFGTADTLSQLIRTAFIAPPNHRLIVVDFSAIEARVIAWLAWCAWRLEVFRTHGKIYEASAEQMFKLPPGSVTKKSPYRQKGKVAELACFGSYTQVLTSRGAKAIAAVLPDDLLWDGEAWVRHDGLIYQGLKQTINLAGIEVTPDHLIRTGPTWTPAQQLASNASILCQALETASASLPSLVSNVRLAVPALTTWRAFSVLAVLRRIWSFPTTCSKVAALGATLALRRRPVTGARSGTPTPRFAPTITTAGAFSIEYPLRLLGATAQTQGSGTPTAVEESRCTSHGEKTKPVSLRICSHLTAGTIQATTWIGSTWTKVTSQATSAFSRAARTGAPTSEPCESFSSGSQSLRPVFDILNSGPRNTFTVLTDRGPLLVHNCGYQGGVGALKNMGALEMGIPEEELQPIIDDWREANPEVVDLWYACERAAKGAVANKSTTALWVAGGRARLVFTYESGFLFITLPSGRRLAYVKPRIEVEDLYRETPDGGRYVVAKAGSLTYEGNDQKTKQWVRLSSYGGKLVENITQAFARDCLAEAMKRIASAGYQQLMTIHDEIVIEAPNGVGSLADVEALLGQPIEWAPDLPLRGDGFETLYYMKEID